MKTWFMGLLLAISVLPLSAEVIRVNPAVGVEEIQNRVREKIAQGLTEDLEVVMESGMYRLKQPWVMDARDADPTGEHQVIYRKARPKDELSIVAISGGVTVSQWRKEDDGTWSAALPRGVGKPREMFNGVTRLPRARFPDEGWLRVEKVGADRRTSFTWKLGDLDDKEVTGGELIFLHDWSISRVGIKALDPRGRRLVLSHPVGCAAEHYAMDHFEKQARYAVEGLRSLISVPGEWAVEGDRLFYMPRRGQKIEDFEPTLPRLNELLKMRGSAEQPLKGVRFEGLLFAHCAWQLPAGGYASGQSTIHEPRMGPSPTKRVMVPAAVTLDFVEDAAFKGGRFFMLGGNGLWLRRGCHRLVVEDVKFDDISGNGLMLGDIVDHGKAGASSKIRVERCVVENCGVQYHGAVGIWAGIARELSIKHNTLSDLPYSGISLGWRWNPEPSSAGGHQVTHNRIHHVMQLLSDGAGIYTLGRQPDSKLANNWISDIPTNAGRAESNGLFLDQGSSGFTIEGNVIHDVAKSPIRFHRAKENIVLNNRWALGPGISGIQYHTTDENDILKEGNQRLMGRALEQAKKSVLRTSQW